MKLKPAPLVTQPPIPPAPAEDPPPPRLDDVLGPLAGLSIQKKYVPAHLPHIPSRHTWQETPVFPKREKDARKIRELATEEGVLAEQAMRKLMASAVHAKHPTQGRRRSPKDERIWDEAMKSIAEADDEQRRLDDAAAMMDWDGDGGRNGVDMDSSAIAAPTDSTMLANYEERFWRKTRQKKR